MKSKKIIIMLICLILALAFTLGACNPGDGPNDESETSGGVIGNDHGGYNEADDKYFVNMPELPADKTEFRVLVYDNTEQTTYYSEEVGVDKYETTDEKLEEAVRNRNGVVEENYEVEIVPVYTANVYTAIDNDVKAATGAYDMAMPFLGQCARLARSNALYDLTDEKFSQYLDLEMPWWDHNATDSLSINNKVYFTTGDISIMPKIVSIAVTFNKQMLKDTFPDVDLYEMVENGDWTLDKMIEMSKEVTLDSTGDGQFTYDDTWGLSSSYADSVFFYLASGERLVKKDVDDNPTIAIGNEKSIKVAQSVLEELEKTNEWVIHAQDFGLSGAEIWQTSLDIFGENRALFRTSAFSAIKKLRKYKDGHDFGVIPMPKYDKTQEEYYTPCSALYAYGVVIPVSAPNPEFSAYMLEVMACEAKNYITDAYYESILKSRDMKDEESEVMLDKYIFNNVVYDIGFVYDFGGISNMMQTLVSNNSKDIASKLESERGTIQAKIDEIIDNYQD